MLTQLQIKQKVQVESKYLDKNIREHMLNILKTLMDGYCSFDYGYIINVNKIISLGENKISSANSLVVFNVTYEVDTLKPIVGNRLYGDVCMVLSGGDGIMVDICNKMQMLIPMANMKPFLYNPLSYSFKLPGDNPVIITNGSKVEIEIIASKYEKKEYSCIGKIII